ncbi:serine--tRNA ligase [Candidatus Babeliales bacterium]|nr:serine--tRNA ligase [Candidatus Babeliales bacterium]
MIDLNLLRKDPVSTKALILKKEPTFDVDKLIKLDEQLRTQLAQIEALRSKKNELAKQGGTKGVTEELRKKSSAISKELKEKEQGFTTLEKEYKNLALSCPNIPFNDIPTGTKEKNKTVKVIGEKQEFSFKVKNHIELNEKLDWFDFQAAAQMSGANFVLYKNDGVKMLYALTNLMIKNNVKYGFEPIIPPYLVNKQALLNSGNLPKFQGDFYEMPADDLCLIPTAEVNMTNLHAKQILDINQLPKRYTAWTSCFRREAGGYGSEERGLIRIHQFEKVELYSICIPEQSSEELERMLTCAQDLLQQLGLHYQVSLLAAQDCSFSSAKTYDLEVWLPGQGAFYEVSSCSNCTDFQARRAKIRYRSAEGEKPELAHTLNSSSLALPRLMVALMEQYQQEDGSIALPDVLQNAMNNLW